MGDYVGDDRYDYEYRNRRRPSPHHMRTDYRDDYLNPGGQSGLYRSRSTGQGPAPTINVYNRMVQDNDQPHYPGAYPAAYPPSRNSPEFRGRSHRLGEDIAEGLADLALDARYRSRSRGRSDYTNAQFAEWQLAQKEQELKDVERRQYLEHEEKRIRNELQLKQLKDEMRREHDRDASKEREKRIVADWERKQHEEKDRQAEAEKRLKEKLEREKQEEKDRLAQAERDYERRKEEQKKKEEEQYNEFLRKQKEKKDKEDKEKREAEEHLQAEMRKRLSNLGYSAKTIDIMVDEEKAKKFKNDVEHKEERIEVFERTSRTRAPVYPKVHRDYLSIETLKYYKLPWEYDPSDPSYIIILQDMDRHQTDVLFEHTSKIKTRGLLDAPKKEKEYAWVRHRSKSRHRSKERIGILKIER